MRKHAAASLEDAKLQLQNYCKWTITTLNHPLMQAHFLLIVKIKQ